MLNGKSKSPAAAPLLQSFGVIKSLFRPRFPRAKKLKPPGSSKPKPEPRTTRQPRRVSLASRGMAAGQTDHPLAAEDPRAPAPAPSSAASSWKRATRIMTRNCRWLNLATWVRIGSTNSTKPRKAKFPRTSSSRVSAALCLHHRRERLVVLAEEAADLRVFWVAVCLVWQTRIRMDH